MLGTDISLVLYYLGGGFVIFLGWAAVAGEPDRAIGPRPRARLHQLALGLAVAGLLHPAFALAGRDLAVQLGRTEGVHDKRSPATVRLTTIGLVVSIAAGALVLAVVLS